MTKNKKNMLFIWIGVPAQQNSQHTGQAASADQQYLLGQPALSLGSLSQHPSTSQWRLRQPKSNTITEGNIISDIQPTTSQARQQLQKKKRTSQNFDNIIFIYFISFLSPHPNLENNS